MFKRSLLAACISTTLVGTILPAHAQYGGSVGGGIAGGLIGSILGNMANQQQQQAREQERAARAAQQQQYEAQRQAAYAQAQANADARREEYDRQQAGIRQQAAMRAKHDAEVREAARKSAAAKEDALRQASLAKAQADRQTALAREQVEVAATKKVADQLETAQTIAEDASNNHCKEPGFAKVVLENFNKFKILNRLDKQVIDIEHLTTDKYNEKTTAMICHGSFLFDDGAEIAGDFEIRKNIAGNLIYLWSPDALDGGRAHMLALNAGPIHDIQAVTGTGGQNAPRMVVIPASTNDTPATKDPNSN